MDNFDDVMFKRTNAELVKIVTEHRNDYQPEAILAADREFARRNLSKEQVGVAVEEVARKKEEDITKASEPLEMSWKIRTFLFPLRSFLSTARFEAEGYENKARELSQWAKYGFCFYAGLAFLIWLLGKIR